MSFFELNNRAVDLMKNDDYGSALETLRCSLSWMPWASGAVVVAVVGGDDDDVTASKCHWDNEMQSSLSHSAAVFDVTAELDVVEDTDLASLRAAAVYGPSACTMFPIVFSKQQQQQQQQQSCCISAQKKWTEACQAYGIILYNHGLLSFLMSCQQQENKYKETMLLQDSYRSLQKAEEIFAALDEIEQQQQQQSIPVYSTRRCSSLPLLRVLVFNMLGLVFHSQELHHEAEEAIRIGSHLLRRCCTSTSSSGPRRG